MSVILFIIAARCRANLLHEVRVSPTHTSRRADRHCSYPLQQLGRGHRGKQYIHCTSHSTSIRLVEISKIVA